MVTGIVVIVEKFLAFDEDVNRIGLKVDVDTELTITTDTRFFAHHFVDGINQIDGTAKTFAVRVRQFRL